MHQSQRSKMDLQHLVSHWHQERSLVHTGNFVNEIILGRSQYHNLEHILSDYTSYQCLPDSSSRRSLLSSRQQILLPTLADALLSIGYTEIVDRAPEHGHEHSRASAARRSSQRSPKTMPRRAGSPSVPPYSAVDAALGEVARRLEAGISDGVAKRQAIDNAGEAFTRERRPRAGGAQTRSKVRPSHRPVAHGRAPSWAWS
jgi:hypothetical protein